MGRPGVHVITSVRNPKIQRVRSLLSRARTRREEGFFVVEGVRLADEALGAGWLPQTVFYQDDLAQRGQAVVDGFAKLGSPLVKVSAQVMQSMSDTQTSQGLLVILPCQHLPIPASLDFALVIDGVRDPGNLGTILRTAAAAGVGAVFLAEGSVDTYSPKVVRAAMGAHFRLPILTMPWDKIHPYLDKLYVYLAVVAAGEPYTRMNFQAPLALVLGGEAEGTSESAQAIADRQVHIPMPGGSESLNVAVAASILMFEVVRQRAFAVQ